jgi:AraC-like DNA-binding protein
MLANTGKTLHQYLLSVRLTKALDLLQTTTLSITEIAHKTGFSDVQQFCKFFLNQTGSTPSSFR